MRSLILAATVSAIALTGSAQAGGFYVGLSAGHEFANVEGIASNAVGGFPFDVDYDASGGTIGLLAGFNFIHDNMLFGIEGDIDWSDISETGEYSGIREHHTEVNYEASIRGRIGIIHGNNIVYVAAGYAIADVDVDKSFAGSPPFYSYSVTKSGYNLGGGVEHSFDETYSGRIEYRYSDYGEDTAVSVPANSRDDIGMTSHAVRLSLIMKM
jgi:outer membrane immunogenic protein